MVNLDNLKSLIMVDWYKKVMFENYSNFQGRARRSEYWYFALMNALISLVIIIPGILFMVADMLSVGITFIVIFGLYHLASIIPTLAVAARRMHDINKSGWYYFIQLIPFIGGIWYLFLLFTEGDNGANNYGPDPKNEFDEIEEIGIVEES